MPVAPAVPVLFSVADQ